ncbi:hypothetical protein EC973_005670 [Apophysomyces ossiformis]|uniref:Fcf2 pre-rRNA processing C-terminal domain-containing protein n=1 Tax=Apophysomyces ossiformis TaxID=679940 RepID=A0A8H7BDQ2_9FUNG|nr:hypothetical protein EC973_005670 [Apophysomyces ossiformis]
MLTRSRRKQLNNDSAASLENAQTEIANKKTTKQRRTKEPVIVIAENGARHSHDDKSEVIPQNGESEPTSDHEAREILADKPTQKDSETESDTESESENDDASDLDDSSDNSDNEDEDDDLDELLKNAESVLRAQQEVQKAKEDNDSNGEKKEVVFTKMDAGISIEDQLYIKTEKKKAQLIQNSVAVTDGKEATDKKALVTLKTSIDASKPPSRKERQQEREKTSGKGWFDMPRTEITPEIRRDLDILKMRHVIDRKRHYKKTGKAADPKYFQVGTIVEGPTEYFSSRMSKRERKGTILGELLADEESKNYYKRKFNETQERTNSGNKKYYKKLKQKRQQWAK